MYRCAKCHAPVAVLVNGDRQVVVRSCACDAAIVGDMRATAAGRGGVRA